MKLTNSELKRQIIRRKMKGEVSAGWAALFAGMVLLIAFIFAQGELFGLVNEVFFTGTNAAVSQGNVTGTWGQVSVIVIYFAIIVFALIGVVALLIGRGEG